MSEKTYYFLTGFPRSGNTLLSSLLNQNPEIIVYANSMLPEMLFDLHVKKDSNPTFDNFPDYRPIENISRNLFDNYYSHLNSKYIFDRSSWSSEIIIELLREYCPNETKILFLHRDPLEILASFIKWSTENKTFLDNFDTLESKCDHLMRNDGPIMRHFTSIHNIISADIPCMFVSYEDIVDDTHMTIEKIYKFFNIMSYEHDYAKIEEFIINGISYNDAMYGDNLHKVRQTISRELYSPEKYLPDSVILKWQHLKMPL